MTKTNWFTTKSGHVVEFTPVEVGCLKFCVKCEKSVATSDRPVAELLFEEFPCTGSWDAVIEDAKANVQRAADYLCHVEELRRLHESQERSKP